MIVVVVVVITTRGDGTDGASIDQAASDTETSASPSETTTTPAPSATTTTATETAATQTPTETGTQTQKTAPPPPPPPPPLPEATPVDPASVGELGPWRYEIALIRNIVASFTIPEGQTYEVEQIGEQASGGTVGVVLVQPVNGGASGVALYTATGVGAVRDGAVVVEGFEDVPASWSTFANFQVGPAPAVTTLGAGDLAVIDWAAPLNGSEPVPGGGSRVSLFAFDTAEDGTPQFTFAEDGDAGSSMVLGDRPGSRTRASDLRRRRFRRRLSHRRAAGSQRAAAIAGHPPLMVGGGAGCSR